jgi:hypothetical protein
LEWCKSIDFKTETGIIKEVSPLIDEVQPNPERETLFKYVAELDAQVGAGNEFGRTQQYWFFRLAWEIDSAPWRPTRNSTQQVMPAKKDQAPPNLRYFKRQKWQVENWSQNTVRRERAAGTSSPRSFAVSGPFPGLVKAVTRVLGFSIRRGAIPVDTKSTNHLE